MRRIDRFEGLNQRYIALVSLLAVMLYIHWSIIQIHPLMFLVWPTCLWLMIEVYVRFREDRVKLLLFTATFIAYLAVTQALAVETPQGIFFDVEPPYNMSTMSYAVLAEAALLFLYDAFVARSATYREVPAYVGFACVAPWLSPAIVEATIMVQWVFDGSFSSMTAGKGVGAASISDILFFYGGRNLFYSSLFLYMCALILHVRQGMISRRVLGEERRLKAERDREWHLQAWTHPISLLSEEEKQEFLMSHGHLDAEQRNEVLRREILPAKGIVLVNPDSF
jgi:hypothetical protein